MTSGTDRTATGGDTSLPLRSRLFRRKSVASAIADTVRPPSVGGLEPRLRGPDLTLLGVSAMIGAGLFTYSAQVFVQDSGRWTAIAFAVAGLTCALAGVCYAELAGMVPVAGSAYTYAYTAFGEVIAWIIGWDMLLEYAGGAAIVAKNWSEYLVAPDPTNGSAFCLASVGRDCWVDWDLPASGLVLLMGGAVVCGLVIVVWAARVLTTLKLALVLALATMIVHVLRTPNHATYSPVTDRLPAPSTHQTLIEAVFTDVSRPFQAGGIVVGAATLFFAFGGFDAVTNTAEETLNPRRVRTGILSAIGVAAVLYILVTGLTSGLVDVTSRYDGESLTLARLLTPVDRVLADLATAGAIVGLPTVVLVLLLGQSRTLFAMCRDGLLPAPSSLDAPVTRPVASGRLAAVRQQLAHPMAPITATVGGLCALLACFAPRWFLGELVNIGTLFAFLVVTVGCAYLRWKRPDLPRLWRAPALPVVAVTSSLLSGALLVNLQLFTWARFGIWMVIGMVVYLCYSRSHSRLAGPADGPKHRGEAP